MKPSKISLFNQYICLSIIINYIHNIILDIAHRKASHTTITLIENGSENN